VTKYRQAVNMSPEVVNLISDAVKILGPALITAIVTFLIARVQIRAKVSEIVASGELKARESLFAYYKERGERLGASSKKFGEELGKMYGRIGAAGGDDEPFGGDFIELSAKLFGIASKMVPVELSIAKAELEFVGLEKSAELASLNEVVSRHAWNHCCPGKV
jgi:hypothetical protein